MSNHCLDCGKGHKCPVNGMDMRIACPVGTYSTALKGTSCTSCPPGETSKIGK